MLAIGYIAWIKVVGKGFNLYKNKVVDSEMIIIYWEIQFSLEQELESN
jgi:hypothetical protein